MRWTRRIAFLHAPVFAIVSALLVLGLNVLLERSELTAAIGETLAGIYFGLYGLYCIQNYLGCREYHCLITGPGFLLAALLIILRRTGIFDLGYGPPYIIFFLAVVIGHLLEWRYRRRHGTAFRITAADRS
jgi:hypothetical protein